MDEPLILVEHHALRQRGLVAYFTWLGLPVQPWLGDGPAPPGRAAVVCVADWPRSGRDDLDIRGLRVALRLRHEHPDLPIVGYSLLPSDHLRGLRQLLAARRIAFVATLVHLDDLLAALGRTARLAG